MNLKKITAAAIAVTAAFAPLSSGSISALAPQTVFAETHGMGAALPDWIPSDFESALKFRNTYGATHIRDGLVCIVFKEQAEKITGDENDEMRRYDIRTTEGMMEQLRQDIYSSDDSGECYEVVTYYAPKKEGKFEVALVDTWLKTSDLDLGYNHAVAYYSFLIDENMDITETDIYSWLPDSETEYDEYVSKRGPVSSKDGFVVFCLDSNAGTPYQWDEAYTSYTEFLQRDNSVDCSRETAKLLDGGETKTIEVYKAINDGKAKIVWNYAPSHDYGKLEVRKALIADCTVLEDGGHVIIDDGYIQNAEFSVSQFSLYSGDLTASSYSIYNKFSKSESAVISSKKELSSFVSAYLNEKALNKFLSQYSDSFFEDNVLLLNTYLDPYQGRIFKHGLKGAYYRDDKLKVDFTSVISANLMRTSYFDILQLSVPKSDYNDRYAVEWQCEEILDYDLKRISVIDEDTGEHIAISSDNAQNLFGNTIKYYEGRNPYYWDTEFYTSDWSKLNISEKYLPEGYELSKSSPKEIKIYADTNSADIIFRVKKVKPIEVKYTIDKFSATTHNLFKEDISYDFAPAVAASASELSEILSYYITEEYQKKYFSEYDDAFFSDKVLLINFFIDSTGGNKVKIDDTDISADNIAVYCTKPSTDFNICNTDYFFVLQAAVPKSVFSNQRVEWKCMGDTNGDGEFGIADLVTLQKWLLADPDTKLYDRKAADLCQDNAIDAFDLVAMRKKLIDVHGLDRTIKYGIEAQFIRTNGYNDGAEYPQITLMTGADELQSYIESNKDKYDLSSESFTEAIEKYDENWFRYYKLMIIVLEEPSGSISHEITELTNKYVAIDRIIPEVGTADMAEWHILIELNGNADIRDNFSVKLNRRQAE